MKHFVMTVVILIVAVALLASPPALAGPHADELSKCLVSSTTDADKNTLVKWMFAAVAVHPAVMSITSISDARREEFNKSTARLFERLITESCKAETQHALRHEGLGMVQASFSVLGQVAVERLLSDPAVARSVDDFANYIDQKKLDRVLGSTR